MDTTLLSPMRVACCGCIFLLLGACSRSPQTAGLQPAAPRVQKTEQQVDIVTEEDELLPMAVDTQGMDPLQMQGKKRAGYTNPFPAGSYEHFVAEKDYPMTARVYSNDDLLSRITATNAKIIICLPQQRARLYVLGRVAFDWPVSTGTDGHETPTGVFRIMEKSRSHHSARYGKWINSKGRVIDSNADLNASHPGSATFRPASMPCWHRLTWDGVGIHGGRVVPGRRLSHGCIRTPFATARKLYEYSVVGMPVYISRAVEDYSRGGTVRPDDVKYRPGGDYSDIPQATPQN